MQLQTLLLLSGSLFAASTAATDCEALAAKVPACCQACMTPAFFSKVGCKDVHDYKCLCAKKSQVQEASSSCVISHCKGETLDVVEKVQEVCRCVGA